MSKKIFLYGIYGIYNYGCEAMIRAISGIIKENEQDSEIYYMSYSYENDLNQLSDCESIVVKPLEVHVNSKSFSHKTIRAIKYIKKTIRLCSAEDRLPYNTHWLRECDVLIIIGGDVFDLLPGKTRGYDNERIWASKVVKEHGGKVFLWGISIGSNIDINQDAKKAISDYFKEIVDKAAIRDAKSCDYLLSYGVNNVKLFADPAFMMRSIQTDESQSDVIGINLSPLANRYIDSTKSENDWIEIWCTFIDRLVSKYHFKSVLLISHVCTENDPSDDDFEYLSKINRVLTKRGISTEIAPKMIGFLGAKEYICKCKILLSARMHCCINSISCGVPTVFLSYSSKSIGMSKFVYGSTDYAINMKELAEESFDFGKLDSIMNSIDSCRVILRKRNLELFENACSAYEYLFEDGCNNE